MNPALVTGVSGAPSICFGQFIGHPGFFFFFLDKHLSYTWCNHILIASGQWAVSKLLPADAGVESKVLCPAAPMDSHLWDGTDSPESRAIPTPRLAALPLPSTFLHERSASRLVSCDILLKQPSLGELACTQECWFWCCPFPPHLQTGARTERREKTRLLGYAQQLPLLRGKNLQREKSAKGKSEGEVYTHQKEIISAKSRLFKNHTDSHLPRALTEPAEEMGFSCARTSF